MYEEPDPSQQHPRVEVDLKRLVIVVRGDCRYEIDLETCTDSGQLLDFILQVSGKPWCDRALAGELLAAIETACERHFEETAQGVFCPGGMLTRVEWKRRKSVPMRQVSAR